ncbi:MAG TPA: DUF2188 domain-containing protein [Acidimicrobiales bacterium]|nr:DUF2188 domain-containing protein [Acidimicrobiales bacterium]
MADSIWVTHDGDAGWSVKREGFDEPLHTFPTQSAALDAARDVARREEAELIWQGEDGRIQGRDSYGNDPRGRG